MKILLRLKWVIAFICILFTCKAQEYDLTVIGRVHNADGLCRIPITLIDMLKDELKINHISPFHFPTTFQDLNDSVKKVLLNPDKKPGKVSLLVDGLWSTNSATYSFVPDSHIKIAYSMFESNSIPPMWVKILNQHFDAVVVPDSFLVDTYRTSGVTIPIFLLPICLNLDAFLSHEEISRPRYPFVFGCTASGLHHKNQILLIQAFAEEFGNSPDIALRLSCRGVNPEVLNSWKDLVKKYGCTNIFFNVGILNNDQYVENMASLDCYVNISKGEGFSIGPREALALEIPCILTNNSAQKTICRSGLVKAIESEISEPPSSDYHFFGENIGTFSNCHLEDVKEALQTVYYHYDTYRDLARMGPNWTAQYQMQNLKSKYLNLIKPKKVILGTKNEITNDYLMTSSEKLYLKYAGL